MLEYVIGAMPVEDNADKSYFVLITVGPAAYGGQSGKVHHDRQAYKRVLMKCSLKLGTVELAI